MNTIASNPPNVAASRAHLPRDAEAKQVESLMRFRPFAVEEIAAVGTDPGYAEQATAAVEQILHKPRLGIGWQAHRIDMADAAFGGEAGA